MPPLPLEERVQTKEQTDKKHDAVLEMENNILFPKNKQQEIRRAAIVFVYRYTLGAPISSEWHGDDGTILHICRVLNIKN